MARSALEEEAGVGEAAAYGAGLLSNSTRRSGAGLGCGLGG